jgi:hypothetical protein
MVLERMLCSILHLIEVSHLASGFGGTVIHKPSQVTPFLDEIAQFLLEIFLTKPFRSPTECDATARGGREVHQHCERIPPVCFEPQR